MAESTVHRERRVPPARLGELLAAARLRKGWRCREAERKLSIAVGYLAKLEMGARCPSPAMAEHLARGLELTNAEREQLAAMMRQVWADEDAGAA